MRTQIQELQPIVNNLNSELEWKQQPFSERIVREITEVKYQCPNCKRITTKPKPSKVLLCGCGYEMEIVK